MSFFPQKSTQLVFSGVLFLLAGCSGKNGSDGTTPPPSVFKQSVAPASLQQCADGGSVISSWSDVQGTGIYNQAVDGNITSVIVCDGAPGQGQTGATGATGATGPQGASGTNGINGVTGATGVSSVTVQTVIAANGSSPCPNGGTSIESWSSPTNDTFFNASAGDTGDKTTTVCNGTAGSNAAASGLFTGINGFVNVGDYLADVPAVPGPTIYRADYVKYTGNANPFITLSSPSLLYPITIMGQSNNTDIVQWDSVASACDIFTNDQNANNLVENLLSASTNLSAASSGSMDTACMSLVANSFGSTTAAPIIANAIIKNNYYWAEFLPGTASGLTINVNENPLYYVDTLSLTVPTLVNAVQIVTAPGLTNALNGASVVASSVVSGTGTTGTQALGFSLIGPCNSQTLVTDQICVTFNQNPGSGVQVRLYLPSPSGIDAASGH